HDVGVNDALAIKVPDDDAGRARAICGREHAQAVRVLHEMDVSAGERRAQCRDFGIHFSVKLAIVPVARRTQDTSAVWPVIQAERNRGYTRAGLLDAPTNSETTGSCLTGGNGNGRARGGSLGSPSGEPWTR